MNKIDTLVIARQAFSEISKRSSSLNIIEEDDIPVEICLTIPVQAGLKYEVCLMLSNNDELWFSVGNFRLSWFPCTNPVKVEEYIQTVCGFLSGEYRILEHYHGKNCVKAELQSYDNNQWTTIGTWGLAFYLPFPWEKTYKEIRNI